MKAVGAKTQRNSLTGSSARPRRRGSVQRHREYERLVKGFRADLQEQRNIRRTGLSRFSEMSQCFGPYVGLRAAVYEGECNPFWQGPPTIIVRAKGSYCAAQQHR